MPSQASHSSTHPFVREFCKFFLFWSAAPCINEFDRYSLTQTPYRLEQRSYSRNHLVLMLEANGVEFRSLLNTFSDTT